MKKKLCLFFTLVMIYFVLPLSAFSADAETSTLNLQESQSIPVIIQQPTTTEAKIGEWITVEVKAEGEDLTYQWYLRNAGAKKIL